MSKRKVFDKCLVFSHIQICQRYSLNVHPNHNLDSILQFGCLVLCFNTLFYNTWSLDTGAPWARGRFVITAWSSATFKFVYANGRFVNINSKGNNNFGYVITTRQAMPKVTNKLKRVGSSEECCKLPDVTTGLVWNVRLSSLIWLMASMKLMIVCVISATQILYTSRN